MIQLIPPPIMLEGSEVVRQSDLLLLQKSAQMLRVVLFANEFPKVVAEGRKRIVRHSQMVSFYRGKDFQRVPLKRQRGKPRLSRHVPGKAFAIFLQVVHHTRRAIRQTPEDEGVAFLSPLRFSANCEVRSRGVRLNRWQGQTVGNRTLERTGCLRFAVASEAEGRK